MDFRITRSIFLAAFTVAAAESAPCNENSARDLLAVDTLVRHGVGSEADALIAFITYGFPEKVLYNKLPEQPPEKCQVLIEAIRLLGKAGDKRAFAPLLNTANGAVSPGVLRMIQRDTLLAPPAGRADYHARILSLLRYNAAVALGLLGDARALPGLQGLFEAEKSPTAKCQYALSMACCGDRSGIDFLIGEIGKGNQDSSVAAARCPFLITGIDFGYRATSPVKLRQKLAEDYRFVVGECD